ncbi:hypothetical protein ABZP36_036106 [Zizania latifolia]
MVTEKPVLYSVWISSCSYRVWIVLNLKDAAFSKFTCATGDRASGAVECGDAGMAPPTTLAEFTLNGVGRNNFYEVSLVDGSNLSMVVVS